MSGAVSLLIDFSNGVTKSFAQIPLSGRMSVTQAMDLASTLAPGLEYEFDGDFVDRGGRKVGTLKSVDRVVETDEEEWGVWLNGRVIGELRQVTAESITPFGMVDLSAGDSILIKLVTR